MNRYFVLGMLIVAGICVSITTFAQHRPYDQVMKDIGATSESLGENLDRTGAQRYEPIRLDERGGILRNRAARRSRSTPPTDAEIQASAAAAVEDATRLQGLFTEIEQFWSSLNTQDAIQLAKASRESATTIVEKVNNSDFDAAQIAFRDIQQGCIHCHFTHRERNIDGFVIKP